MPKALDLTSLVDSSLSPQNTHIPRCTLPHLHSTPKSDSQILHCDHPPPHPLKRHNRIPNSCNPTFHISLIIKLYIPLFNFPSKPGRPVFSPAPNPARTAISGQLDPKCSGTRCHRRMQDIGRRIQHAVECGAKRELLNRGNAPRFSVVR